MSSAGRIMAFDRRTGSKRWSVDIDAEGATPTVVVDEDRFVLVATERSLYCVGYEHGAILWRAPLREVERGRTTLLVDEGFVLLAGPRSAECFDRDGRHLWQRAVEVTGDWTLAAASA